MRSTPLTKILSVQYIILDYGPNVLQSSRTYSSCLTKSLFLPPPASTIAHFDSMNVTILDTAYKWNHAGVFFSFVSLYDAAIPLGGIHPKELKSGS